MNGIDWILYAPQYHFAMGLVAIACLILVWRIYKRIQGLLGRCPLLNCEKQAGK